MNLLRLIFYYDLQKTKGKYWEISLDINQQKYTTHYGSVNSKGQTNTKKYKDIEEIHQLIKSKIEKGYNYESGTIKQLDIKNLFHIPKIITHKTIDKTTKTKKKVNSKLNQYKKTKKNTKKETLNIFNPFIVKYIIPIISNFDWDSYHSDIKKGDIIEYHDKFNWDRKLKVVSKRLNKYILEFEPTKEELKTGKIIYKYYDWKTKQNKIEYYPYELKNNLGYYHFNINQLNDNDGSIYVIERPYFTNMIHSIQLSKIKAFKESGVIFTTISNKSILNELKKEIQQYSNNSSIDYHPHSNNKVRDIVHPSLYPYIKNKSKIIANSDLDITEIKKGNTDYWNRPYEDSKYQWLPSEFIIDEKGNCKIDSYINNLPVTNETFINSLENLFTNVLPHFEKIWSYINTIKLYDDEDEELYGNTDSACQVVLENKSLKNRTLQVITKIVTVELDQNDIIEGTWHVEGMSHENIVATSVYVIEQTENIEANLYFKRRFTTCEGSMIHNNTGQDRPAYIDTYLNTNTQLNGLIPLGHITTKTGSLTLFPNSHIHKLDLLNKSKKNSGKRTVVVFWLINPDIRIISTKHIHQQQNLKSFTLIEAKKHREKLMKERKYHKQQFNVRTLNLCEH